MGSVTQTIQSANQKMKAKCDLTMMPWFGVLAFYFGYDVMLSLFYNEYFVCLKNWELRINNFET